MLLMMQIEISTQIQSRLQFLAQQMGQKPEDVAFQALQEKMEEIEDYLAAREVLANTGERVWTMAEVEAKFGLAD